MSPHSPTTPLKLLACLHLAAVSVQPVLAGQYLVGNPSAMDIHGTLGEMVAWLGLAQGVFACICWWTGRLRRVPVLIFIALFALAGLQVHAGHNDYLALHIPLGSLLLAASALMTVWMLRQKDQDVRSLASR